MRDAVAYDMACAGWADERELTATVADWFGRLLLAPMDEASLDVHRSETMRGFLFDLGLSLDRVAAAQAFERFLSDAPLASTAARMGHAFVLLFEGVAGPNAISLYESAWSGEGLYQTPFVEMMAILRALDVSVGGTCCEPPDHVGLELAALAEALRQANTDLADRLAQRLRGWIPHVASAVAARADAAPYRELFVLLDAFVSLLPPAAVLCGAHRASLH